MLKSLEMFGFKSFADRMKFDFAPGVTCVVGPNGSGKSNVVDAIKWILGDQSPKSLRGKEMTDVIFNGSANRKPAGLAEALLTFDNSKRVLGLDADEVVIGRRIYRSGEAEYLINRIPARLKDIKELFLGTGAGTAAYSIIEQGRVDQLLQASAVNRRVVFEEAAGVSRFKAKKIDAQRKLERVAQNLLRLTDIVKEVEQQLNSTRSQASKAAKYRELSQELRTLRIGSAADDYRDLSAQLVEIERQRGEMQARIDELNREAQDCESQQRNADSQLAEAEDRLRASERREAENREAIAGYEATVKHQLARKQELEGEYARLQKQQTELAVRAQQVAGELEQTVVDLQTFAAEFERRKGALGGAEETARELADRVSRDRDLLERQRQRLMESVRQGSIINSRVTTLQSRIDAARTAHQSVMQRIGRLDRDIATVERSAASRTAAAQEELDRQTAQRERLAGVQARRTELLGCQSAAQQNLAELREQRGAVQARRTLLDELERRQEGLGVGVKEILELAQKGDGKPWNHVLGHVGDLLEVDIENAALLEVALGNRAQLIVLDDGDPLIDFLNEGKCRISGRVGFLAVPQGPRRESEDLAARDAGRLPIPSRRPDLSGRPGVVSRADRLVRSASGIHRLSERLLEDTWIVSTLDAALQLAATTGDQCRFVTLQGELLEANGTLFVGSLRSETALVSRKGELRGIKNELLRLDRRIEDEEAACRESQEQMQEAVSAEQQLQFELDVCSHRVSELKSEAGAAELDLERLRRDWSDADAERSKMEEELEHLQPEVEDVRSEMARLEVEQKELQTSICGLEQSIAENETRQQRLHTLHATEQLDLAKYEERLLNLQNARTRLDQERFQRDLHHEEAERRFQLLAGKRDQIELELLNTNAVLAELAGQRETLSVEVAGLQVERERARRQRGELSERELQARHRLRELKDRHHALEMKTSEVRHQLTSVADRLRDEFQIELADVVASGASARQAVLEARQSTKEGELEPVRAEAAGLDALSQATNSETAQQATQDEIRGQIEEQINRLRRKLKQIGQVNTDSLKELDDLETRFARLSGQLQDLMEAKNTLEEIIRRINSESKRMFLESFAQIRQNFQELFRKLFGGGEGDVILENSEDVLECGIDIVARPPGKELRSISLLSGGEKTMTAVALLLAIFKSKPSPYCILDEVDAALDDGNVGRYLGVIKEFQQWTQFIIVSHRKQTMAGADVLYGVTMEEAGVSKRMSVRFEDVSEDGHFKPSGAAAHPNAPEMTSAA